MSPLALNPTGRKDVLELLRTASTTVMGSLPEMELFLADPRTTRKSLGLSQELMKALLQTDLRHPLLIQVMLKPNQYSSVTTNFKSFVAQIATCCRYICSVCAVVMLKNPEFMLGPLNHVQF